MILSICLNCSLDTRYTAPGFAPGSIHSVEPPHITAGGKGLNLARVGALLGEDVMALGLVGGGDIDFFTRSMAEVGVKSSFTPVPNPTRRCLNIIDPQGQKPTEVLERGYPIGTEDFEEILSQVQEFGKDARVICASGSVPPGLPDDVYAQLGELARSLGKPFILDARGEHFRQGLTSRPFAVKPNFQELEQWAGVELRTEAEINCALKRLNQLGIALAIVSLGQDGAIAACQEEIWRVTTPPVQVLNPVGSGDAFTAGLAASLVRNLSLEDSLRLATACGTANALHPGTGQIDPQQVEELYAQIQVTGGVNQ